MARKIRFTPDGGAGDPLAGGSSEADRGSAGLPPYLGENVRVNAAIFHGSRASALVAVLALLANVACHPAAPAATPRSLAVGEVVETALAVGAVDRYAFAARADALVHLTVEQRGVDLVVVLRTPGEERAVEINSPNRRWGPEEIWWSLPEAGRWQVEVRAFRPAAGGRYAIRIAALGPPTDGGRLQARALAAVTEALHRGDRAQLADACALWRATGERRQEAFCALREADLAIGAGLPAEAESALVRALELSRQLGDARQETDAGQRLGEARRFAGDLDGAWDAQQGALALARRHGLLDDQASALNNLASIHVDRGEIRAALGPYRSAAALLLRLGDRAKAATVLLNEGASWSRLGRFDPAAARMAEALQMFRESGDRTGECATLTELGWVERLRGIYGGGAAERACALTLLEQALACRRSVGDLAGEAGTLDRLGTFYREARAWDDSLAAYQGALGLSLRAGAERDVAYLLSNLADLALDRGDFVRARHLARASLHRLLTLPGVAPEATANARFLLGRAEARLGDPQSARQELELALTGFEALRAGLGEDTLTVPFFAIRQFYFDGALEALLDLDARFPRRGFKGAALEVAERAQRRSLIDSLAARARRARGSDPLSADSPFDLRALRGLLDEETLLLEFALTEEGGALFVLGRREVASVPLPGRRALEPLIREVHESFARGRPDAAAARRLSSRLLGQLAAWLPGRSGGGAIRRLAIVSSGPLAYVPFAALPWPKGDGPPLIERFELVQLPSAATLLAQRQRRTAPDPGAARVAVIADPVFSPRDARVRAAPLGPSPSPRPLPAGSTELSRAARDLGLSGLERLPATRGEALAIAALAPGGPVALDFAASREAFDDPAFQRADILHFATHALEHPRDPNLSGIVLSLVDATGRPRPGYLRAGEIAGLNLRARLVVLSACRTALGPEVRGEGLMGLSRAFLHAGARGVVASLWSVRDRASARLMERFYRALLSDGLSPAAALRRAQLEQRADPRTRDASEWAGFELQGDWR